MYVRTSSLLLATAFMFGGTLFTQQVEAQRYRDQDRRQQVCAHCGTVRAITRIHANERRNNTGAIVLGAVIGGALGNQVGSGSGRQAATVAGAVAGGAIANRSGRDRSRGQTFYRINVRMDNGRLHNFDQYDTYGLRSGSRVEISGGEVRRLRR